MSAAGRGGEFVCTIGIVAAGAVDERERDERHALSTRAGGVVRVPADQLIFWLHSVGFHSSVLLEACQGDLQDSRIIPQIIHRCNKILTEDAQFLCTISTRFPQRENRTSGMYHKRNAVLYPDKPVTF